MWRKLQAYFNFGVLLGESLKRREEALTMYKESIRIHPDFPDAYHTMGTTYTSLGRYAEVRIMRKADRLHSACCSV
jgi:tetratricopeptide (TPR) repeat protein